MGVCSTQNCLHRELQRQQPRTVMVEECIFVFHPLEWGRKKVNILLLFSMTFCQHLFICCCSATSLPSSSPNCYLSFSRSRGERGPNRKQPPVAHVCSKGLERNQRDLQALCLIHNIICNISMSQTAPTKQCLMIQTHKTHTSEEWEDKMAWEKRHMLPEALVMDGFPKQRVLESHVGYFFPILPLVCPEGVTLHPAKLYFNLSASRGLWLMSFSALLSPSASMLQLRFKT